MRLEGAYDGTGDNRDGEKLVEVEVTGSKGDPLVQAWVGGCSSTSALKTGSEPSRDSTDPLGTHSPSLESLRSRLFIR